MVVSETFAKATMVLDLYRMKAVLLYILTFFILIYILIHYNPLYIIWGLPPNSLES